MCNKNLQIFLAQLLKTLFILPMLSKKQKHALLLLVPQNPLLFKRLPVMYSSFELWEASSFQDHFISSLDTGLQFVSFATFIFFSFFLWRAVPGETEQIKPEGRIRDAQQEHILSYKPDSKRQRYNIEVFIRISGPVKNLFSKPDIFQWPTS